ncbi:MAG: cytochrome c3 family protein [Armatimonadetes bacterium]|nr:cytochrome c3 family protein [Armatimonadota bacterium]
MANLFKPSANSAAKVSLLSLAGLPVVLFFTGSQISRSSANTGVENPLSQPIPFSHQHHAYELGIDCRYCHTGVERTGYAGLPQTETCMSCHSQIWTNSPLLEPVRKSYETGEPIKWALVNKVPEFVYFNHSIHVNRGVSCNNCHGPIQKMHITYKGRNLHMSWCLQCHSKPEEYLYSDEKNPDLTPRQQVFNFYLKLQTDPNGQQMGPQEQQLALGNEQRTTVKDLVARGNELLKQRGVKKAQLQDCAVCHH